MNTPAKASLPVIKRLPKYYRYLRSLQADGITSISSRELAAVQEDPRIEGLLVLLNTVGGDVEAGLALAELIASVSKPSATLVLGGGHSIGIPLAVSAQRSFIVPTATMTVHPVRHSGVILGVPQTMHWFDQMQQRITGFVAAHSGMTEKRYTELMLHTGELVMDMGTVPSAAPSGRPRRKPQTSTTRRRTWKNTRTKPKRMSPSGWVCRTGCPVCCTGAIR